jgi:hypothetical protein
MSKNSPGSLGYQMMKALQRIFQPGASRHKAKRRHQDAEVITGISTMRCMSADVHQFARFIRFNWPEVKHLSDVRQEMALAYIEELKQRERSGGNIARVCASLRKLETACRKAGIFPPDAPPLLPYKDQGRPGGFHSKPKPVPYTEGEAQAIIAYISQPDPIVARLLTLMWAGGLRITKAVYLRTQDIDLEKGMVSLNQEGMSTAPRAASRARILTPLGLRNSWQLSSTRPTSSRPVTSMQTGRDYQIGRGDWSARLVVNWASSLWQPTVIVRRSAWRNLTGRDWAA